MLKSLKTGWHVLYVRSCQEKKVHELLQENQLESFLPMLKVTKQWSDRKKTILKPFFPSYVFVKINSAKDFNRTLSIEGACNYVCFGKEYARVKREEIFKIKLLTDLDDIYDIKTIRQSLEVGEIRKINFGTLNGLECEILKVNNINKIVVRIDSLKQNIIATLPSSYLSELSMA
ncbi:UpxY family transcription antiterminator [Aquimarina muelleri]|uniref:UpxY family transcription antiterminator n=1 Tax=Aquimarina muelleri TaxID=279356 RepID=UPI003F68766A